MSPPPDRPLSGLVEGCHSFVTSVSTVVAAFLQRRWASAVWISCAAIALILAAPPAVTAQDSVLVYTDSTCILEPAVEEGSCPDLATLDSQYGIRFARYVPTAGSPGYRDLQFVYSSGIFAAYGDTTLIEQALDNLASMLLSDVGNIYGVSLSDIALLYNMSQVTSTFPYPYGDVYYATHGGGNMLFGPASSGIPEDSRNHIDIVMTTPDEAEILKAVTPTPETLRFGSDSSWVKQERYASRCTMYEGNSFGDSRTSGLRQGYTRRSGWEWTTKAGG